MSQQKQHLSFTYSSLRVLAVLAFLALMLVTNHATSMAQECMPGCQNFGVSNCLQPPRGVDIIFITCCNGVLGTMPGFIGPAMPPVQCFYQSFSAPAGCTILGAVYGGSVPAGFPPPGHWLQGFCSLEIR